MPGGGTACARTVLSTFATGLFSIRGYPVEFLSQMALAAGVFGLPLMSVPTAVRICGHRRPFTVWLFVGEVLAFDACSPGRLSSAAFGGSVPLLALAPAFRFPLSLSACA